MVEKICQTCGNYHQNGFECSHWGDGIDCNTCHMWHEGMNNENILYRINKIEETLKI